MRIDSCRKCGVELEVNKKCNICKEANQFFCHNCGHITEEQIHLICSLVSLDYNILQATIT